MTRVMVQITGPDGVHRTLELGEFHAVWESGITVGSDPGCTVVLPDLPPVAAQLTAASNHRMLRRLPEGTSQRVDSSEFALGPWRLRFQERSTFGELSDQLRVLAAAEPRAAASFACACLRRVLDHLPAASLSAVSSIEILEAWARGEGDPEALTALSSPSNNSFDREPTKALGTAAFCLARAALIPASAPEAAHRGPLVDRAVSTALHSLPYAQADALSEELLSRLPVLRWPLCVPTRADVLASSPVIAVAWDSLSEERADQSLEELLAAHGRAERLGLDWSDPLQRAVAERTSDEESLGVLLRRP